MFAGVLPVGDEPNAKDRVPWVNFALIAANVVVFVLTREVLEGPDHAEFLARHALVPAAPTITGALQSMFLHAGFLHLFGNMFFLWIFGDNVEAALGHVRYLLVYLGAGVVGGCVHVALNRTDPTPVLGASGAVSGALGAYFIGFPGNRVRVAFWFLLFIRVFSLSARWVVGAWFVLNDVLPTLLHVEDDVAHGAHIGGFGAGVLAALAFHSRFRARATLSRWRPLTARDPHPDFGSVPAHREAIARAIREGRGDAAADAFERALRSNVVVSLPEDEAYALAGRLYERGDHGAAREALRRFLLDHPDSLRAPAVAFALGWLLARRGGDAAAARRWLLVAEERHPDARVRNAARAELARLPDREAHA